MDDRSQSAVFGNGNFNNSNNGGAGGRTVCEDEVVDGKDIGINKMSMAGFLFFIQEHWHKMENEKVLWALEKAEYDARIAALKGERRGQESVKSDLIRRIKMLEYALRQERKKTESLRAILFRHDIDYNREMANIQNDCSKETTIKEESSNKEEAGTRVPNNKNKVLFEVKKRLKADTERSNEANQRWKKTRQFLQQCLTEIGCNDELLKVRQLRFKTIMDDQGNNLSSCLKQDDRTGRHNSADLTADETEVVMHNFDFLNSSEDITSDSNNETVRIVPVTGSKGSPSRFSRITKGGNNRRDLLYMFNKLNDDQPNTTTADGKLEHSHKPTGDFNSSEIDQQDNPCHILSLHDATGAQMSLGDLAEVNVNNENENLEIVTGPVSGVARFWAQEAVDVSGGEKLNYGGKRMLSSLTISESMIASCSASNADFSNSWDEQRAGLIGNVTTQESVSSILSNVGTQLKTVCTLHSHLDSIRTISFAPNLIRTMSQTNATTSLDAVVSDESLDTTSMNSSSSNSNNCNPPVLLCGSDDGTLKLLSYERQSNSGTHYEDVSSESENFDLHCAPNRANPCILSIFYHTAPVLCSHWSRLGGAVQQHWQCSKTLLLSGDCDGVVIAALLDNAILEFAYSNQCDENAHVIAMEMMRKGPSVLRPVRLLGPTDAVWSVRLAEDDSSIVVTSADGCLYMWSVLSLMNRFEEDVDANNTQLDAGDEEKALDDEEYSGLSIPYHSRFVLDTEWIYACIRQHAFVNDDDKEDEMSDEALSNLYGEHILPTVLCPVSMDTRPGRSCFAVGLDSGHLFIADFGSVCASDEENEVDTFSSNNQLDLLIVLNVCIGNRKSTEADEVSRISINCITNHTTLPLIIVGLSNGNISVLNCNSACIEFEMSAHEQAVTGIAFHPMALYFATVSHDDRLRVWNALTYACCNDNSAHRNKDNESCLCVAFQEHGEYLLASGGADGVVKVFKFTVPSSNQSQAAFHRANAIDQETRDQTNITMVTL